MANRDGWQRDARRGTTHTMRSAIPANSLMTQNRRGVAKRIFNRKICVVAMTPGWVRTEMGGANAPLTPEQSARAIAQTILSLTLGRSSQFIERTGEESKYAW